MRLEYIGSAGTIDFTQFETQIFTTSGFHAYEWTRQETAQTFGVKVDKFTKEPLTYEMTVAIRGTQSDKEAALNQIAEITEQDVVNKTPGRLYWKDYYLDCYILKADTQPSGDFWGAERSMTIFAPYPFWIKEETKQFLPVNRDQEDAGGLDYDYDYDYDYALDVPGQQRWNIDHYAPSEFQMILYGYCQNPRVMVGDYPYQVFDTCEEGEYIVIDSRAKTVVKHLNNGDVTNIFDLRAKENSVFEKIPGGNQLVTWAGTFGVDITLFMERSEPKW